jgi:hypothetical protein
METHLAHSGPRKSKFAIATMECRRCSEQGTSGFTGNLRFLAPPARLQLRQWWPVGALHCCAWSVHLARQGAGKTRTSKAGRFRTCCEFFSLFPPKPKGIAEFTFSRLPAAFISSSLPAELGFTSPLPSFLFRVAFDQTVKMSKETRQNVMGMPVSRRNIPVGKSLAASRTDGYCPLHARPW